MLVGRSRLPRSSLLSLRLRRWHPEQDLVRHDLASGHLRSDDTNLLALTHLAPFSRLLVPFELRLAGVLHLHDARLSPKVETVRRTCSYFTASSGYGSGLTGV